MRVSSALLGLAVLLGCNRNRIHGTGTDPETFTRTAAPNPIAGENALPGDGDWYIGQESPAHEIEGYASATAVEAGETLDVRVSVSAENDFSYAVYRLG